MSLNNDNPSGPSFKDCSDNARKTAAKSAPPLFRALREAFFVAPTALSPNRRANYLTVLWTIISLHALGVGSVLVFTTSYHKDDFLMYFCSLLQVVSVISGLFLFIIALKSEVIVSQTYEFAASSAQSTSWAYKEFYLHVEWLNESLSPERFPNTPVHLYTSVSTPLYGIGTEDEQSVKLFLEYFGKWVMHFEAMKPQNADPPIWEIAVWNQADNIKTFGPPIYDWNDAKKRQYLNEYAKLLSRAWKLHLNGTIDLRLYETDRSDARVFMVKTGGEKYSGLVVLFTPLTPSAIHNKGWALTGFSFQEERAFENLGYWNRRLQHQHHCDLGRVDIVDVLRDPLRWLEKHYGIAGTTALAVTKPEATKPNESKT